MHLSWSTNLERRLRRLLLSYAGSGTRSARWLRRSIRSSVGRPARGWSSSLLLHRLAKKFYPDRYLSFLKLRIPWFVGITTEDPFPRSEVTNKSSARLGMVWGPFAGRGIALEYEQELLGLFQMRRCPDVLTPAPEHPGCIYGEMNQCLRPCQCVVTQEEYSAEANRVVDFLANNGRSALATLSAARERASENMQFEEAAIIHKRIDRIKAAAACRPAVVEEIHGFSGVALTSDRWSEQLPALAHVARLLAGARGPSLFNSGGRTRSLDSELRELLAQRLEQPQVEEHPVEELAIFARWYYSSWCDGEWFPLRDFTNLNYRKLVRQISRMVQASAPTVT